MILFLRTCSGAEHRIILNPPQNNTIMYSAPSSTVECLSKQLEDLTQVIYSERVVSADLRMEFSELQKEVNSTISPLGAYIMHSNGQISKTYSRDERSTESRTILGEVKVREHEIVRKGIDQLEMQIKQYISMFPGIRLI